MSDFDEFSLRAKVALSFMDSCIEMRTEALKLLPWWRRKAAVQRLLETGRLSAEAIAKEAFQLADAFLKEKSSEVAQ